MRNLDIRIGEMAASVGVTPATLRAWERRYGAFRPTRTHGGHRVYGDDDRARIASLVALINAGIRPSEAVGRLEAQASRDPGPVAGDLRAALWEAVDALDAGAAQAVLARCFVELRPAEAMDGVIAPVLRRLGDEWRQSPRNIAREHMASTLVRSRLVDALPRSGERPCLAFSPEGEGHDIGLLMAALVAAEARWVPVVLGANTPRASVEVLLAELRPRLVLVSAVRRGPASRLLGWWRRSPSRMVVAGGMGFKVGDEGHLGGWVHNRSFASLGELLAGNDGRQARGPGASRAR